jgi:acyl carrier protein
MQSSSSSVPAVLSRYPAEAQAAYLRFVADGNAADLGLLVRAALREFMPRRIDRETAPLSESAKLIDDLGLDSLGVAEMIFFFEDLFNVSIPSNEILGLQTVADLESYVRSKLDAAKSAAPVAS